MRISLVIIVASVVACGSKTERQPAPEAAAPEAAAREAAARGTSAAERAEAPQPASLTKADLGDVVSCAPTAQLSSAASRMVQQADRDGNGQVSRAEAQALVDFVLGGFFFRADANADGKVTPEEGRDARQELTTQHPAVGALLSKARQTTGESPFQSLARVLDVNYGQTLTIEDARSASRSALDDLFRVTDTNKDGSLSAEEARSTTWDAARSLGRQMFARTDTNGSGSLDTKEFEQALQASANVVFKVADADNNGQLTEQEARVAMGTVVRRLGLPDAPEQTVQ